MPAVSLDSLPLLFALIVPGFVWTKVHEYLQAVPKREQPGVLHSLTLSGINLAVWSWMIPALWVESLLAIRRLESPTAGVALGWLLVSLVSPTLLGLFTGFANRRGWLRTFLSERLKVNIPSPIGTAWDYVFCDRAYGGALWASATLNDGSVVEGIFGADSMASSVSGERDLYLEQHFKIGAAGDLEPVESGAGVWLAAGSIKAVEFKWIRFKDASHG